MVNYDKETIIYHLTDIGIDKTCILLKMTEEQVNKVLDDKVFGESPNFRYKEDTREYITWEPLFNPELFRVINKNYFSFKTYAVRNKLLINTRAISQEDVFHNCLLSAIRDKKFQYIDDETTMHYLKKILKQERLNQITLSNITIKKGIEIGVLNKDNKINAEVFEFESEIIKTLTPKQKSVFLLLLQGFSKTEIGEKLGVHITTVIGHVALIRKKFKNLVE